MGLTGGNSRKTATDWEDEYNQLHKITRGLDGKLCEVTEELNKKERRLVVALKALEPALNATLTVKHAWEFIDQANEDLKRFGVCVYLYADGLTFKEEQHD
jgi:hypothetical protein